MNKPVVTLFILMSLGFSNLSHARSIEPGSVHPIVAGKIYRGGVTEKAGIYSRPITDFSYACENGFTMVVNAYSNARAQQVRCADGRTIVYVGDKWYVETSATDSFIADEISRRQGKVLVHCVYGVDASQLIGYIVAAKAGLMSAREAAARFVAGPAGVPHRGKMERLVLKRGQ